MAKFDLAKYWDFRTWVKSQIAQLRALISEYQQSGGGNTGGSGSSDFDPAGTYPKMTVGKATNIANAPVLAATEDEQITVKVGNKVSNPLTVPYAQRADFATDLSGRVEATPEVFTYRPSAGDKSIKDDNAYIRRVKGNSIVYGAGQILKEINANNWAQYSASYADISYGSNECTITINSGYTGGNVYQIGLKYKASGQQYLANHTYLAILQVYFEHSGAVCVEFGGANFYTNTAEAGKWVEVYALCTLPANKTSFYIKPNWYYQNIESVGKTYSVRNVMLFDLTSLYGEGAEPTFEEFREQYPDAYYPAGDGSIRNLICYGIRTVGFNAFNGVYAKVLRGETYYLGGEYTSIGFTSELGGATETITIPSNRLYTPTEIGYIYATGSAICINLSHTGYRDGEYEPYKEVTHALPLSQITNGEPLRKAGGDVYDEVNNDYYIRRVGVRSYTTGDKDDSALLTDGTYTNYPLDEPIYTPINTPIDFNYYVEDFGTEEALLADDSAPFSADIVYQFNATDQIRNNYRNFQWLKKSAFVPSGTAAQYIRGDGSYGDVTELSHGTPIHDGEYEMPDEGDYDMSFTLTPSYYAKSPRELDGTTTIAVLVTAPEDSNYLAEYWFEFAVGETLPNIEYNQPNNSDAVFRINGNLMTYAVNVLHLISSDGGITFYGELKNYSI